MEEIGWSPDINILESMRSRWMPGKDRVEIRVQLGDRMVPGTQAMMAVKKGTPEGRALYEQHVLYLIRKGELDDSYGLDL